MLNDKIKEKELRNLQVDYFLQHDLHLVPLEPNGKHPYAKLLRNGSWQGYTQVSPSPYEYEVWKQSDCNFAVLLGEGLVVLDFDTKAFLLAPKFLRMLPKSLLEKLKIVATGSGYHVYLFYPNDGEIKLRNKILARNSIGQLTIELKSHLVSCPPSVHDSGQPYTWCTFDGERIVRQSPSEFLVTAATTTSAKEELLLSEAELTVIFDTALSLDEYDYMKGDNNRQTARKIKPKNPMLPQVQIDGDGMTVGHPPVEFATTELGRRMTDLSNTSSGERNLQLFNTALFLGRVAHIIPESDVMMYLSEISKAAVTNGMVASSNDREVEQTIRSGMRTGINDPLNLIYVGETVPFDFLN